MHEMGLCEAIVDAVLLRAEGRRVRAVRVRVAGHPVVREVVDQGFALAAAGTVAEGAELDLVVEPPGVVCRLCAEWSPVTTARALLACPRCGGLDVVPAEEERLVVEAITFDTEPAAVAGGES
ncbi:hydrogenase nickel incorporation protein HypA/HybF [Actinomadura cellulosilytica]|uniref:Hydrogenase nickel incorporation protein HypA/HybF n=2 Tax=Thermomonospora cellulosilytica TaxID=1411118 RepID=A0A7W3MTK1_9ACTN|nr:hydrogenase nickel incorporation protein HypA/HybF [Thermomonospora cellulosilytica]